MHYLPRLITSIQSRHHRDSTVDSPQRGQHNIKLELELELELEMERVEWQSRTFAAATRVAPPRRRRQVSAASAQLSEPSSSACGVRDLPELRRRKAHASAAARLAARERLTARLAACGVRAPGGAASDAAQAGDANALSTPQLKFFKAGMARRERKLGTDQDRHERAQREALRKAALEQRREALERPGELRANRVGMREADAESARFERHRELCRGRKERFDAARGALRARGEEGFLPGHAYGRSRYFALQGLRKKVGRLQVESLPPL